MTSSFSIKTESMAIKIATFVLRVASASADKMLQRKSSVRRDASDYAWLDQAMHRLWALAGLSEAATIPISLPHDILASVMHATYDVKKLLRHTKQSFEFDEITHVMDIVRCMISTGAVSLSPDLEVSLALNVLLFASFARTSSGLNDSGCINDLRAFTEADDRMANLGEDLRVSDASLSYCKS